MSYLNIIHCSPKPNRNRSQLQLSSQLIENSFFSVRELSLKFCISGGVEIELSENIFLPCFRQFQFT